MSKSPTPLECLIDRSSSLPPLWVVADAVVLMGMILVYTRQMKGMVLSLAVVVATAVEAADVTAVDVSVEAANMVSAVVGALAVLHRANS